MVIGIAAKLDVVWLVRVVATKNSKIGVTCLLPGILEGLIGDVALGSDDPVGDLTTSGAGDRQVGVLVHQPSFVLHPQLGLESLVVADVDRLNETVASRWNELHLDAETLDRGDDRSQHVLLEQINE
jgi:hypothetical protein